VPRPLFRRLQAMTGGLGSASNGLRFCRATSATSHVSACQKGEASTMDVSVSEPRAQQTQPLSKDKAAGGGALAPDRSNMA
jgi:hypothetical protein